MKRLIIVLICALLLSGCAQEITDYTLQTVSTSESTAESTVPTEDSTAPTEEERPYREYATYPVEKPADNIIGNHYYYTDAWVVSYYDIDLQRRVVLCSQPNCTHNSEACTAYLGGSHTQYQVVGDMAYAVIHDETERGELQVLALNLVSGEREILWEFAEEGEHNDIEGLSFSVDRTTAFLRFSFREYELVDYNYLSTGQINYAYALHLDTGEVELLFAREVPVHPNMVFNGDYILPFMCTEEFLLEVHADELVEMPLTEEEYYQAHPTGDYWDYLHDFLPDDAVYSINRATGERTRICGGVRESKRQDMGVYRERKMSFAEGDTIYIYDGRTGKVTPCFTREGIALQMYKDGRIIYNICKEDGGYDYYWYDLTTGETQQFQKGEDGMIFSLNEETADYFIGLYQGRNCFIHKQDFYNENYDAAF